MAEMNGQNKIGLLNGIGLTVATLFGSSLFAIPALSATIAGQAAPFTWILVTVGMIPIAYTFGELGKRFPHASGTSHYVKKAFGPVAGNTIGWLFVSTLLVGSPPAIFFAASYLAQLMPKSIADPHSLSFFIVFTLLIPAFIGVKVSSMIQTLIAVIASMVFLGLLLFSNIDMTPISRGILGENTASQAFSSIAVIFWAFIGIEAISHLASEFKNPKRDYLLAVLVGVIVVGFVYLVTVLAVLTHAAHGDDITDSSSMAWIFGELFGDAGSWFASLLAFVCCYGAINIYFHGFTRMMSSMAQNRELPKIFARVNQRGVPLPAALLTFSICLSSVSVYHLNHYDISHFVKYTSGVYALIYFATLIAAFVLLKGFARIVAIAAFFSCLTFIISIGWSLVYAFSIYVLIILWFAIARRKKNQQIRE